MYEDEPEIIGYFDYDRESIESMVDATRDESLSWVQDLAEAVGRAPGQDFLDNYSWRQRFDHNDAVLARLTQLRYCAPPLKLLIERYGSWLGLLVEAGILPHGARRTSRGTQVLGHDGCVCLSLAEAEIDNLLARHGIAHRREIPYPDSTMRCDWLVGDIYIEYFGLTGTAAYDAKTSHKLALAEAQKLRLLAIYPSDLDAFADLERWLLKELADYVGTVKPPSPPAPPVPFSYVPHEERVASVRLRHERWLQPLLDQGGERFGSGVRFEDALQKGRRPAFIWKNGCEEWYLDHQLHRRGGPARYVPGGAQEWYFEGQRHRDDGPAVVEPKRNGSWYLAWYTCGTNVKSAKVGPDEIEPGWYLKDPHTTQLPPSD